MLLKSFSEIKREPPPYPVYKALLIPYRDGDNLVDAKELRSEDVENWSRVLERLHGFLEKALAYPGLGKLNETDKLELIGDFIVLFFRLPLLREVLPSVAPNPLKAYLFFRLSNLPFEENVLKFIDTFYYDMIRKEFSKVDIVKELDDPELCNLIERCWFSLPADTRPAFNTSGLIPHLLITSAISWAMGVQKGLSRKNVALLRLAALLHDMGKPFRYVDHVNASIEVCEKLVGSLVKDIEKIRDLIEAHHRGAEITEAKIISEADRIASAMDRIRELADEIISPEISKFVEDLNLRVDLAYETGVEAWRFWTRLNAKSPDLIKKLSELFVQEIRKRSEGFLKQPFSGKGEIISGIELALVDVGDIQEFVTRASDLRCVAAASLVVDTLVMTYIPLGIQRAALDAYWVPLESMIYAAGGIVEVILPEKLVERTENMIENISKGTFLRLRFAHVPLNRDYAVTKLEMGRAIYFKKVEIIFSVEALKEGGAREVRNLCKICFLSLPSKKIDTPDGPKEVCDTCSMLYEIGSSIHFKQKYISEMKVGSLCDIPQRKFGLEWDEASRNIIEMIAGHDEKELKELREHKIEYRNLAVIKLDGNLMGPFMFTCVSPTDAYERSARIDLALKKAVEKAIEYIFNGVARSSNNDEAFKAAAQIKLGILYAGGDDALVFMPSWAAPVFSLIVGKEFAENMGRARGISIGLAVGKSKASIWALIGAASSLLEESKEAIGRKEPSLSSICFDISDVRVLTGTSAKRRLEELKRDGLTVQPLKLMGTLSFEELVSIAANSSRDYIDIVKKSYLLSRSGDKNEEQKKARRLRSALSATMATATSMLERLKIPEKKRIILLFPVYAKRQVERGPDKDTYQVVLEISTLEAGGVPYSDIDRLIKIMGGGVL